MATRIAYAIILLVNSILSWILYTDWAIKKLQGLTLDYFEFKCDGNACTGFTAVQRINFALGVFHFVLGILLFGVKTSRDGRASIQNGYWGPKIILWIGMIVASFFIPDRFFVSWGNSMALFGAILFILLGLILLVDLAHNWAEWCIEKIENTDSNIWRGALVGSALSMYIGSLVMTIVMYIYFADSGCKMNQSAITINLLLFLIVSVISIHPAIQSVNPRAGLAQSAMVAIYCTYLTMSAVAMEPDDANCNPLVRSTGTRKASVILGAIITFATVAYTTTRAATYGLALGSPSSSYTAVATDDYEHGMVTQQPGSRREMRAAALRAAIESGSLPASALDSDSDSDSDAEGSGRKAPRDDERDGIQYNYTLFHLIFLLSTAWVATLITMTTPPDTQDDFVPVGRTYGASWAKIISAWVCYAIYIWSLAAPVILPERFEYS